VAVPEARLLCHANAVRVGRSFIAGRLHRLAPYPLAARVAWRLAAALAIGADNLASGVGAMGCGVSG
jgi:hypothetical protein